MKVAVKLAEIICHQETSGSGSDEVAAFFAIEPLHDSGVRRDTLKRFAMVVDSEVNSDDGPENVDLAASLGLTANERATTLFNADIPQGLRIRLAGLELDGVGTSTKLARTQMDHFERGDLPNSRHDRLWDISYVVYHHEIEEFLLAVTDIDHQHGLEDVSLQNHSFTSNPLSASNRWLKVTSSTAHHHLRFTNSDEGSDYEIVLGFTLEYEAPEQPEPIPSVPFPHPFPFPMPFPFRRDDLPEPL